MYTRIASLILVGSVALATLSEGSPKKTPEPGVLTHAENVCEHLGKFAFSRAKDRDAGFSLFTVLRGIREFDLAEKQPENIRMSHDYIIYMVYDSPTFPPLALQRSVEVKCFAQILGTKGIQTVNDRY